MRETDERDPTANKLVHGTESSMIETSFRRWMSKNLHLRCPIWDPEIISSVLWFELDLSHAPNDFNIQLLKSLINGINAPLSPGAHGTQRYVDDWLVVFESIFHPLEKVWISFRERCLQCLWFYVKGASHDHVWCNVSTSVKPKEGIDNTNSLKIWFKGVNHNWIELALDDNILEETLQKCLFQDHDTAACTQIRRVWHMPRQYRKDPKTPWQINNTRNSKFVSYDDTSRRKEINNCNIRL